MKPAANIRNSKSAGPASRPFILAVVSILCLGILGSALFTFATLSRMRKLYLSNRGHSIASSIEAQARGPGRRNNPAFWQSLFEEACESHSDSVAYLALVDQNGRILASRSGSSLAPSEMEARVPEG